jgi:hypothetical protein
MNTIKEALNCMDRVCEIAMDPGDDYLDLLWQEIETTPDDTPITIPAGNLKSFFHAYMMLESYLMEDIDGVRRYFEIKNLI